MASITWVPKEKLRDPQPASQEARQRPRELRISTAEVFAPPFLLWLFARRPLALSSLSRRCLDRTYAQAHGTEFKSSTAAGCGLLLGLEIMEGKERMKSRPHADSIVKAGAACTVRLLELVRPTHKLLVLGDS